MEHRWGIRALFALVVVGVVYVMVAGALAAPAETRFDGATGQVAPPTENVTVITTDSNSWLGRESGGPRANAEILALAPNGSVYYYNDSHTRYWDVDPVPNTSTTVEYVYADHVPEDQCGDAVCTENGVEQLNLSTGEVTPVFSRITEGKHSTRWHDVDRIDETHRVVADIAKDRVFVVDVETGIVEWSWAAQSEFDPQTSGGEFPSDWTHINDVEYLDSGVVMASMRNHDQVVFLDRQTGLLENRTLGADGHLRVIYEQHNPDYIPGEDGGPAVLIGDSENNRVVEYQRVNDSWRRTWAWGDGRLGWPRDADRLPDGHTLITDSHGNRVLEVARNGSVVWSTNVAFPYEAERLGTGDESTNGPSAVEANLTTQGGDPAGVNEQPHQSKQSFLAKLQTQLTGSIKNGLVYVLPVWVGNREIVAGLLGVVTILGWAVAEWRWSPWSASFEWPVRFGRRE